MGSEKIAPSRIWFSQHHQMRAVDAAEMLDMTRLGIVKKRAQHRVDIDRIGKAAVVARAGIFGSHRHPFRPASMTPRTM